MPHGGRKRDRGKKISREEARRRRERQRFVEGRARQRSRARSVTERPQKTIFLNEPAKNAIKAPQARDTRGLGAKTLDIISSTLLEPTTFIRSPSRAGRLVAERRARTTTLSQAVGTTSEALVTAGFLTGGLLGTVTAGGRAVAARTLPRLVPRTVKGGLGATLAGGILVTSPGARRLVGRSIEDPTRAGREAGLLIEKLRTGEDVGGFKEGLKKAGLIGAGLVGTGLLIAGAKKVFGRDKKAPVIAPLAAAQPISNLGTAPTAATTGLATQAPTEQVITPTASEEKEISAPPITVNTNIKIDNKSSLSRRFINIIE